MKNKNISRREFLKELGMKGCILGTGAVAFSCNDDKKTGNSTEPSGEMTYRTSSTGDKVSLLGYGCMRWPLRKKDDGSGEEIDQEMVNELVDYAIAHGVNYFDTAPPYVRGMSEKATGIALSRHPRSSYYIATKLSTSANDRKVRSRENSIRMYQESFRNLQVDYIDYYLIHIVGMGGIPALKERLFDNGMLDFLLEERKAGRIRNLGWSFHGEVEAFDYMLELGIKWDFVQIQMNYVDWKHASGWNVNAEYLYGELAKRDIPVVIMEPLLGGRLASLTEHLNERLSEMEPENSIASWAFRFAGSYPKVLTVLSGMTYMEHLQDNIKTFSPLVPLNDKEMEILEDTAKTMIEYPSVPCTACQYCMPCPYGLDIPSIFSHYNKCINEGNICSDPRDPEYRKARRAFLIGYDRRVPKMRQAAHCVGCGQCAEHCPQKIDIVKEMRKIDRYTENLRKTL